MKQDPRKVRAPNYNSFFRLTCLASASWVNFRDCTGIRVELL